MEIHALPNCKSKIVPAGTTAQREWRTHEAFGQLAAACKNESEIVTNDLWTLPDAGKDGNKHILMTPFTRMHKVVREVHVFYDQKSLEARLDKVRGFLSLNQAEKFFFVTAKPLDLVERDRLHLRARTEATVWDQLPSLLSATRQCGRPHRP